MSLETTAHNGAQILLETLIAQGVDTIFGYPGGAVLPLYDALHAQPRIRHILVRHEQAAVHAAEGYARSTGKPGVVLVTSGPGMANTTSGLLDALCDSIPVLCISGQVATTAIGTAAFQECDAIGISRPVTKWNAQVRRIEDVASLTAKALRLCTQGRPGPVLLDFPKDIQMATLPKASAETPAQEEADSLLAPAAPASAQEAAIKRAAAMIAHARRPVFYGGGGLINSGTDASHAFTSLVQETGAPCTLTLMGLGAYPAKLSPNSHTSQIYGGAEVISERHRHRYEVNSAFIEPLEKQGLIFAGMSPDGLLPEIVERPDHPWFVGVQFHPELKSRPFDPHPLFASFIAAALKQARLV